MQQATTQTLSEFPPEGDAPRDEAREWPMHARGVGQMLDLAVDLFVARCVPTVGIAFLMWLPVRLLLVGLESRAPDLEAELDRAFFGFLGSVAVQTLSVALVIQVVYAELQGRPLELGRLLGAAARRSPALLVCTFVITVALSFGFVCLIVPGFLLMYIWSVAPAALVLEGCGPLACLRRSRELVGKSFLRWAGVMTAAFALKLPYDAAVGALDYPEFVTWASERLGGNGAVLGFVRIVLGALLLAVSSAAWSIAVTVFYLDCRVRREGFDLSMRLERLQDAAHAARTP